MFIYAIILIEPNAEVKQQIAEQFPGYYEYSPTFFLVEGEGLAEQIATAAKIKGENRIESASGFVLKLESFSYSGFTARALWEWLKEAESRDNA